ncbi:preprotein translocase subunit SecE [Patescibacteria group bacterium]|nr:preprotein translocase subunit SecE [Patescibacteria group bacterium]
MSKVLIFLREVQAEFKNITWPTKNTLLQLSFVVISISIVISLILGGFDYLFTKSFGLLTKPQAKPTEVEISTPSAEPLLKNLEN